MRNRMFKKGLGLGLMVAGMIFLVNIFWAKNGNSPELEKTTIPLSKTVFIFLEIEEENDDTLKREYTVTPLRGRSYFFDEELKSISINNPQDRPTPDTLIIVGHKAGFRHLGTATSTLRIDSLPYVIDLANTFPAFRLGSLVGKLSLLDALSDGTVRMEYNGEVIILGPDKTRSLSKEQIVDLKQQKDVKVKNTLHFINHGKFHKNPMYRKY